MTDPACIFNQWGCSGSFSFGPAEPNAGLCCLPGPCKVPRRGLGGSAWGSWPAGTATSRGSSAGRARAASQQAPSPGDLHACHLLQKRAVPPSVCVWCCSLWAILPSFVMLDVLSCNLQQNHSSPSCCCRVTPGLCNMQQQQLPRARGAAQEHQQTFCGVKAYAGSFVGAPAGPPVQHWHHDREQDVATFCSARLLAGMLAGKDACPQYVKRARAKVL